MNNVQMWTAKEIKFLHDNYNNMSAEQAALELERPQASVRHQAYRQGLKFKQEWEVQDYAYYKGDELICVGKIHEIEKVSGVKQVNLLKYRFECYQKRSNRILIAI